MLAALSFATPGGAGGVVADAQKATCTGTAAHAAARVVDGKQGIDPNSVTAAQAKRMNDRLDVRIQRLIKAGTLRHDGHLAHRRLFKINTYVHVITASDGSGGVTPKQIRDQIKVMNHSFAGQTAHGTARTPFSFKLVSVDTTKNDAWFNWPVDLQSDTESPEAIAAKNALHRGGWADLNVYIANLGGGLLGYATFPQDGVLALDGLVLLNESLPGGNADFGPGAVYNQGDTATHEIGHWLGLFHTFQNGCNFPGDEVADTPYQFDGDNIFFCNETDDTCAQPGRDPVHNFMSYGDDPCLDRFTNGQDLRMIGTWLAYRA
jgi:hypothetical protein